MPWCKDRNLAVEATAEGDPGADFGDVTQRVRARVRYCPGPKWCTLFFFLSLQLLCVWCCVLLYRFSVSESNKTLEPPPTRIIRSIPSTASLIPASFSWLKQATTSSSVGESVWGGKGSLNQRVCNYNMHVTWPTHTFFRNHVTMLTTKAWHWLRRELANLSDLWRNCRLNTVLWQKFCRKELLRFFSQNYFLCLFFITAVSTCTGLVTFYVNVI